MTIFVTYIFTNAFKNYIEQSFHNIKHLCEYMVNLICFLEVTIIVLITVVAVVQFSQRGD